MPHLNPYPNLDNSVGYEVRRWLIDLHKELHHELSELFNKDLYTCKRQKTQTFANGSADVVSFSSGTTLWDPAKMASGDNVIIQKAGRYRVTAALRDNGAGSYTGIALRVRNNGSTIMHSEPPIGAGGTIGVGTSISDTFALAVGDAISVQVRQLNTGSTSEQFILHITVEYLGPELAVST